MGKVSPARAWIKEYKLPIERYARYCEGNDWTDDPHGTDGYTVQKTICESLLGRIKFLSTEYESQLRHKYVMEFRDFMLAPVLQHLERCRFYIKSIDPTQLVDPERRAGEMAFQQDILSDFTKLKDKMQSLNLDAEVSLLVLPIRANERIPLLMSRTAERKFPEIIEYRDLQGIPSYDGIDPSTSKEMFINMKNPPKYDRNLHYYEQSKDVMQFYSEELHKIRHGININGTHIHPWLYWHANYMVTDIPMAFFKGTPKYDPNFPVLLTQPSLRDNEWFFAESYAEADEKNVGLFIFGTRRYAKTIIEASVLTWRTTIVENSESVVIGGDVGDLQKLSKSLEHAFTNVNPAFKLPRNNSDWGKHIQLGLKTRSGQRIPYSDVFIKNVREGVGRSSEKAAGATPTAWILDEAGKFNCRSIYQGAIPSFQNVGGWALVPILSGTGGNKKLSMDAQKMLLDPEGNDILPMNWDKLENMVGEADLVTWKRKSFGTFLPGQMSFKSGLRKRQSNFSEFLGIDSKELAAIDIKVTRWEAALEILKDARAKKGKDKLNLAKEKMYYPLDPMECFLNRVENPFPSIEAQAHMEHLIEEGRVGKYVDVMTDYETGGMTQIMSERSPASYPHDGGNHTAPVVIFDNPHKNNDCDGTYVGGLDHYKQDKSSTDSLGAFYVFKRSVDLGEWSNRIVASYVSRPNTMDIFNKTVEIVMKGYGAEVLQENMDISFQQHLERKDEAAKWLANGEDLARKMVSSNARQNNRFGLYPSTKNKQYVLQLVISYCHEDIVVGQDANNNDITVKGVTRIPDIQLLEEIINFNYTGNFDRIIAFGHALAWDRYLTSLNIMPDVRHGSDKRRKKKKPPRSTMYGGGGGSMYSK